MLIAAMGFFESVLYALKTFISLIGDFLSDVVNLVVYLKQTINTLPQYLMWLPSIVSTMFVGCCAVIILYKILGRD